MEFSSTSNESSLPVFNGQKGRGEIQNWSNEDESSGARFRWKTMTSFPVKEFRTRIFLRDGHHSFDFHGFQRCERCDLCERLRTVSEVRGSTAPSADPGTCLEAPRYSLCPPPSPTYRWSLPFNVRIIRYLMMVGRFQVRDSIDKRVISDVTRRDPSKRPHPQCEVLFLQNSTPKSTSDGEATLRTYTIDGTFYVTKL